MNFLHPLDAKSHSNQFYNSFSSSGGRLVKKSKLICHSRYPGAAQATLQGHDGLEALVAGGREPAGSQFHPCINFYKFSRRTAHRRLQIEPWIRMFSNP